VLAYLIPTFATGFLWHLVLFREQYAALGMYRADVIIPLGFTSMLMQGLGYAWVYPRLFDTGRRAWRRSAVHSGSAFAAFAWSFTTLAVSAKHVMSSVPGYVAIETGFTVVQFAIVAPLMALAYRRRE
jgi:hypothetical protein